MASFFSTGTINEDTAGNVGRVMVETIRDAAVAHGWVLVEEYTPASSLVTWYVLKCPASLSGLTADFYVVIGRTLGSGELRYFVCETYTQATHTAQHGAGTNTTSGNVAFDTSGRYAASSVVLGVNPIITSGVIPSWHSWVPSGVSTKWWVIVTEDSLTASFNGASNGFFHIGAYTPLHDLSGEMPIQQISHDSSQGELTRNPAVISNASAYGSSLMINGGGGPATSPSFSGLGMFGPLDTNDKLNLDKRLVGEIGITNIIWSRASQFPVHGYWVGKQKHMRAGQQNTTPAGIAFGDAYVLSGRLWVPWHPTSAIMWDTGIAA